MPVCSEWLCPAEIGTPSFGALRTRQELRIAIHRRKRAISKFLFMVAPLFPTAASLFNVW
jgi:hypothetical protein